VTDVGGPRTDLIGFEVAYQLRRNRVTVAFRLVLAIPQLIVVYFLGIAAGVVALIGWFAALFTGRLARWVAEFLAGFLGWSARVYAYLGLLVDAYPPFDMGVPLYYPVQVSVPPPGRLNRAAVAFRLILVIPAYIVAAAATSGLATVIVLIWLMLVIGGRMPPQLFQAMTSIMRFYLRVFAYLILLTPAYPSGLFAEPLQVRGAGSGWQAVPTPLGGPAKAIISILLVLGLASEAVYWYLEESAGLTFSFVSIGAWTQLTLAHDNFVTADNQALAMLDNCQANNPSLSCVELAYAAEGSAYSGFASKLESITFPRADLGEAHALLYAVQLAGEGFTYVAGAPDQAAFEIEVRQRNLKTLANTVGEDYTRLHTALKPAFARL
jgi:hypothetical protein